MKRTIPPNVCDWSNRMDSHLRDWPIEDVFENIEAICDSYGYQPKWRHIWWVIQDVPAVQAAGDCWQVGSIFEAICSWAENHSEPFCQTFPGQDVDLALMNEFEREWQQWLGKLIEKEQQQRIGRGTRGPWMTGVGR